jgi:hypothetical protein
MYQKPPVPMVYETNRDKMPKNKPVPNPELHPSSHKTSESAGRYVMSDNSCSHFSVVYLATEISEDPVMCTTIRAGNL